MSQRLDQLAADLVNDAGRVRALRNAALKPPGGLPVVPSQDNTDRLLAFFDAGDALDDIERALESEREMLTDEAEAHALNAMADAGTVRISGGRREIGDPR